jgi:shikimate kinase
MMKTNIVLIGFMGTGKTAVGRELARRLGLKFIETDALVTTRAGRSIPEIFQAGGEIGFREAEIEAVREAARERRAVIACGGGAVLNWINVDRLRETGVIVRLTATPTVALRRVSREVGQRPLLEVAEPLSRIREMLQFREPFYRRAADLTVNTSRLGVAAVTEEIITRLQEDASFDRPQ